MTDTRDKLPSRPSSIGQAHRIIVQLKARVEELDAMLMLDPTYADLTAKIAALEAQVERRDKLLDCVQAWWPKNKPTKEAALDLKRFVQSERTRIADMGEKE